MSDNLIGNRAGGADRVVAHQDDLSIDEATMADDLIVLLATKGLLDLVISTTSRSKLWGHVFRDWDSSMPVPDVGQEAPKRDVLQSSLQIGTLTQNAGETENKRAGQPVFVRPSTDDGQVIMRFEYLDKGGEPIPPNLVVLDQGITEEKAISEALTRFETYESHRVNDWNLAVIVMWSRRRLLAHLEATKDMATGAARVEAPVTAPRDEEENQLLQFKSVMAIWARSKALILSVELDEDELDA